MYFAEEDLEVTCPIEKLPTLGFVCVFLHHYWSSRGARVRRSRRPLSVRDHRVLANTSRAGLILYAGHVHP